MLIIKTHDPNYLIKNIRPLEKNINPHFLYISYQIKK